MNSPKAVRTLTTVTPMALAAILGAAAPAAADISDATLHNPHVLNNGSTLGVEFSSTATATDKAAAQSVAAALGGGWISGLIDYAAQNAPQDTSTCRVTATAKDPDGATGTATATLAPGTTTTELAIADQVRGTKWGIGDRDNFKVQLTCTDSQDGNIRRVTVDDDQIAG
jgi:hypothetical protein